MATTDEFDALQRELCSPNLAIRQRAVRSLAKYGSNGIEPLILALRDRDRYVRQLAAEALASVCDARAKDALLDSLHDEDMFVRGYAIEAIGKIKAEHAVETLLVLLRDDSPFIGLRAAVALGRIGAPRAVTALAKAYQDGNAEVKIAAIDALARIGDPASIQPLSELIREALQLENASLLNLAMGALNNQLPRGLIANPCLTPLEKHESLQAIGVIIRKHGARRFSVQSFCQEMLRNKDEDVRKGAKAVMDYLTLGRAAETQKGDGDILLRPAAPMTKVTDTNKLPRAAEPVELDTSEKKPGWSVRLNRRRKSDAESS